MLGLPALAKAEVSCGVTTIENLPASLQAFSGPVFTRYQNAASAGEAEELSAAGDDVVVCSKQIVDFFVERYFDPAFANKPFDANEYENVALKMIQNHAVTDPRSMTRLAMDIQTAWEARFLASFIVQERTKNFKRHDRIHATLAIAGIFLMAGPKFQKFYMMTFKQLPRITTMTVGRVAVAMGRS
jgi:hypothetical protein